MIFGGIRLRLPIPVSNEVAGYVVVGVAVILVGAGVWLLMEKFRKRAKADLPKPSASSSTAPSVSTSQTAESYALETEAIKLMAMVHTRNEWIAFCNQFPDLARSELRKQLELFLPRAHIRLHASLAVRQLLLHNPKLEAALISKALIDLPGMDQHQQYEMMGALVQIWPHLEPQGKVAQ